MAVYGLMAISWETVTYYGKRHNGEDEQHRQAHRTKGPGQMDGERMHKGAYGKGR